MNHPAPNRITELEMLVAEQREVISDNDAREALLRQEINNLRYHLHRCRESAYQVCFATAGVLPEGYGPAIEAAEQPQAKPAKRRKA